MGWPVALKNARALIWILIALKRFGDKSLQEYLQTASKRILFHLIEGATTIDPRCMLLPDYFRLSNKFLGRITILCCFMPFSPCTRRVFPAHTSQHRDPAENL